MRPKLRGAATLAAAIAFAVCGSGVAQGVRPGWTTLHPPRLPLTLQLPDRWQIGTTPRAPGVVFVAGQPRSGAALSLSIAPFASSWIPFTAQLYDAAKEIYGLQDPHAVIRFRSQTVAAGRAFEVIVLYTVGAGSQAHREYVKAYNFLEDGRQYDFEYACSAADEAVYAPVFTVSARSIRFT